VHPATGADPDHDVPDSGAWRLHPGYVLARLTERASDTDIALGSDVMTVALQGYGLLKLIGRAEGIQSLRQELGWERGRSRCRWRTPCNRGFLSTSRIRSDAAFFRPLHALRGRASGEAMRVAGMRFRSKRPFFATQHFWRIGGLAKARLQYHYFGAPE